MIKFEKPVSIFLALMAIALQIQVTLFATADYRGLRVSTADFLIPVAGFFVLFTLIRKQSLWPRWSFKRILPWFGFLFAILTTALVNGYLQNGYLSNWAFFNKYLGFIFLICYFALGGWIATNFGKISEARFITPFASFYVAIMLAGFFLVILQKYVDTDLWLSDFPWEGLMANRNAFMLVGMFVMILLETTRDSKIINTPLWIHAMFWALIPIFSIYNASRTGWIAAILFLVFLAIKHPARVMKKILPILLIGASITYICHQTISVGEVRNNLQFHYLVKAMRGDQSYGGDKNRYVAVEDALELYKKSNPIFGAGLGSYRKFQEEKRGEFIDVIDFTSLWLLTETGALGVIAFLSFFLAVLYHLYKITRQEHNSFAKAVFIFLIFFAAMTFLHELMYTRFLWFILGLTLAVPYDRNLEKT